LRAFTLIELILVMTILLVVMAVAFPSLRGFFRGRNLDSEARRILALTRYGQSRAVAEGVPVVLGRSLMWRSRCLRTNHCLTTKKCEYFRQRLRGR
jgi:type II secretion system protein H